MHLPMHAFFDMADLWSLCIMNKLCIVCAREVKPRQHAVTCDVCERWQHRACTSGIILAAYREATKNHGELHFICQPCEHRHLPDDDVYSYRQEADNDVQMPLTPTPPPTPELPDDWPPPPPPPTPVNDQDIEVDDQEWPLPPPPLPMVDSPQPQPIDPLEVSFDLPHRRLDGVMPEPLMYKYVDGELPQELLPEQPTTYCILEKGSKRGGRILLSSTGFSYGVKANNKNSVLWRCNVRSRKMCCRAVVRQRGDNFGRGPQEHCHPPSLENNLKIQLSAEIKSRITDQVHVFQPAMTIVKEVVRAVPETARFLLPNQSHLKRVANRHISKMLYNSQ